jgi:hypothetical protein
MGWIAHKVGICPTAYGNRLFGMLISEHGNTDDKKLPAPSITRRRSQQDGVRAQVANEFYATLKQLSADPDPLAVVGSWRGTRNDDEILAPASFNRIEGPVQHWQLPDRPWPSRGGASSE